MRLDVCSPQSSNGACMITIDRETLYQEVWSTPGRVLAKKYGVSDVALAKACKRHDIPRPPPGHWAKVANGKHSIQSSLPVLHDPRQGEIRFYGKFSKAQTIGDPELEAIAEDLAHAAKTRVPDKLVSPHRLVQATREYFKAIHAGHAKEQDRIKMLSIQVSRPNQSRALRIMNTLIKAWESLGGQVAVDRDMHDATKPSTYFVMDTDRVKVNLEEQSERLPDQPRWKHDRQYTGQLFLRLESQWSENLRGLWSDGKRQRLEDLVESILEGLLRRIDCEKRHRLDQEISARQSNRAKQCRAAARQREEDEKIRRKRLIGEVSRWQKAQRIRRYLSAIKIRVHSGTLKSNNEEAYSNWMKWASWYADHIDPLVASEAIPGESVCPTNTPIDQLEWTSHARPILEKLAIQTTEALYALTEVDILAAEGHGRRGAWAEVCRVLEGLGYDMAGRRYWLH